MRSTSSGPCPLKWNGSSRQFPPGIKYQVAFNTTDVVEESINEVLKTLAEAIALVVLVIFIFLQTWRSTIIPAVTIPVSLIGAFAFTKLMGFSINTLTLFGIILATGIVVDDAIVVIENIERHIQEYGKSARQAASDAMREVFGAVLATGLVLIAVFVPVAFFPGTTGRLYAQFSMTIAFAVALSVFNAVTLTPALSALLLERESHHKGRFFSFFEKDHRRRHAGLRRRAAPRHAARWAVVLLFVGALGLTYWVYRTVPQAFVPEEDQGYFLMQVQAPAGRVARVHRQRRPAGREDHHVGSRRAGAVLGHGVQLQRRRAESGVDVRAAEAIRRSAGGGALGPGRPRPARRAALRPARARSSSASRRPPSRAEPVRRLRVPDSRSDRTGHLQPGAAPPRAIAGGGQPVARSCAGCSARSRRTIRSCR